MPGTTHCARCGMSFSALTAAIAVEPPRAGRFAKWFRRWFRLRQSYYQVRDVSTAAYESCGRSTPSLQWPTLGVFLRMIVPGWAHRTLGFRIRGLLLQATYFPLLIVGILTLGSLLSAIAIGLAFSVHAASILDIMLRVEDGIITRLFTALAIMAVLFGVVYFPVDLVVSELVSPRQVYYAAGAFDAGDVVLINPSAYDSAPPQRGDVVLYSHRGVAAGGYRMRPGELIGRVLAGPGMTVEWKDGRLFVDGELNPYEFMGATFEPAGNLRATLAGGTYLIDTAFANAYQFRLPNTLFQETVLVSRDRIEGRVFLRHYPLSRWWWVK
jgi:Signal peptidase, peptidase S26